MKILVCLPKMSSYINKSVEFKSSIRKEILGYLETIFSTNADVYMFLEDRFARELVNIKDVNWISCICPSDRGIYESSNDWVIYASIIEDKSDTYSYEYDKISKSYPLPSRVKYKSTAEWKNATMNIVNKRSYKLVECLIDSNLDGYISITHGTGSRFIRLPEPTMGDRKLKVYYDTVTSKKELYYGGMNLEYSSINTILGGI